MKVLLELVALLTLLRGLFSAPVFTVQKEDFVCPADGVFPIPNECNASYYLCSAGDIYLESCPDGYLFDPLSLNCVSEEQASCVTTTVPPTTELPTADPSTTEFPTTDPPTTLLPTTSEPFNCPADGLWPSVEQGCSNQYWSCTDGVATLQRCQNAMVFDPELQDCKLPANVPSCNA